MKVIFSLEETVLQQSTIMATFETREVTVHFLLPLVKTAFDKRLVDFSQQPAILLDCNVLQRYQASMHNNPPRLSNPHAYILHDVSDEMPDL